MAITFKPVDKENWRAVCKLKVADDQQNFVAPNWASIIAALFEDSPDVYSMVIMGGETMVGYALYAKPPESRSPEGECWIIRLMIDAAHQRKGYGRAALAVIIPQLRAIDGCNAISLSVVPENQGARRLYESVGFVHEGRIEHDELVYTYKPEATSR